MQVKESSCVPVNDNNNNVPEDDDWEEMDSESLTLAEASLLQKILRRTLMQAQNAELNVIRQDPSSPLFSVSSFEDLNL